MHPLGAQPDPCGGCGTLQDLHLDQTAEPARGPAAVARTAVNDFLAGARSVPHLPRPLFHGFGRGLDTGIELDTASMTDAKAFILIVRYLLLSASVRF